MSVSTRIMNKLLLLLALLSSSAFAGQSAALVCVVERDDTCIVYELRVSITADGDSGLTGAFGIGIQLADGRMASWSSTQGFVPYEGGFVTPVFGVVKALPASGEYVIFRGSLSDMCRLSYGKSFEVWAGRGIVPPDKLATIDWLIKQKVKLPADHLRGAYIQNDVLNNPWKVAKVFSYNCNRND